MADAEVSESLRPAPHGLSFNELKSLIEYLDQMQEGSVASLSYFRYDKEGFETRVDDPAFGATKTSKASTATCLAYLKAAGMLGGQEWDEETRRRLRSKFVNEEWKSACLPEDNPFTSAFLLEAIHNLGEKEGMKAAEVEKVDEKIAHLNALLRDSGGLRIKTYPRTAFLTHKVVRVLGQWKRLEKKARERVERWTWSHLNEESGLIAADSPDADYFELAYSVLTASITTGLDRMTPRQRRLLQHAISQFFAGQRPDGNWPRSRPLFLYPNIGYAYCYDYELLVQLLSERRLRPFVMPYLTKLRNAALALVGRRVPLDIDEAYGWSSEHHGSQSEAESWPTASVFHFCFEFRDLVFDAVRQGVFEFVDAVYEEPRRLRPSTSSSPLGDLMDSTVRYKEVSHSFKDLFQERFLDPLLDARELVGEGQAFPEDISISVILYGPPGTSKTRLAGMVSKALGWPLLSLDPSHLTRRGLDNVHAEANELFGRLEFCDQIVVLMDEFDELVREREGAGELQSRFLTTAMLPKIAALHGRRRLVYIVATNHVEQFDAAISRPGRFDIIIPLMPPTADEKVEEWQPLAKARTTLLSDGVDEEEWDSAIEDLTYAEAEALSTRVASLRSPKSIKSALNDAVRNCTLNKPVDPKKGETWKARLKEQEAKIQGLGL